MASTATILLLLVGFAPTAARDRTLTLLTHDSFFLPDAVIEAFEERYDVDLIESRIGDAGSMVNQAILTKDDPLADVLFGIDNTFLSRALAEDIFMPYRSGALDAVSPDLLLDAEHRVTPIDYGDVCINIDREAFTDGSLPLPTRLEDLIDPVYAGKLVIENPATSSPGLAFLLATVAYFGEDPDTGWPAFWRALRDNDVRIANGWEAAYRGGFSGGSGEGDRPLVVSYTSSPAFEVLYGPDPDADESPTASLDAGCFRQIEFAGVLKGASEPELAGAFIDFLLEPSTQAEMPLSMFVYPARADVAVPESFARHVLVPTEPLSLAPDAIAQGRERWIREWTDIVLR